MTAEVYPNEHQGRIVITSGHPSMNSWQGGHIEEVEDTDNNCVNDGLHYWVNITSDDEFSYNYWIIRRSIAWSAKLPDNDLPPVYGPSQVCDFEQNMTSLTFTVKGNSVTTDGTMSLDLYYRHSDDNANWTEYTLYETDTDKSDGWSWEFSSPNGAGCYQFYSIRNVDYEGYIETEKVPPGPDAKIHVIET
jgi:hypothetical protein